jgi:glutamate/tyrosine decarboxylase-like PLP-dependent enzyme
LFVSGGSMANLTALAAARHAKLSVFTPSSASPAGKGQAASAPTWAGCDLGRAVAYASDQTHSSLEKAFRVLGFAPHQYVRLPTDDSLRLPPEALARRVAADQAAGLRPFCVVATAGTTNAGAVDPLPELAAFCRANDLWLHADGAYGAAAALCEENRKLLQGLELVDSLSIDPHKWLFQPYEIGCVLVRNWEHLFDTFHVSAEYLRDVERASEYVNFQDCGIQLTRGFRALKLWMSLKVFGLEAFKDGIRHGIRLAELTQQVVAQTPRMEVVTPAQLGIVTFRYLPDSAQPAAADEVNKEIVDRLKTDGFAMLTTTAIRGRTVLRMCTIHPGTTEDDIRRTVRRLKELGDAVEAARRKTPQP